MKKKFLGRVLTMLLVASMVFTLLPAPAIAAGTMLTLAGLVLSQRRPGRKNNRG